MFKYFPPNRFQKCNRVLLGLFLFSLALGSFHCAVPETQAAVQVTLAWDPNNEPDLAGYKVYYGTSTKDYGVSYDAGNVNSYTISGLQKERPSISRPLRMTTMAMKATFPRRLSISLSPSTRPRWLKAAR